MRNSSTSSSRDVPRFFVRVVVFSLVGGSILCGLLLFAHASAPTITIPAGTTVLIVGDSHPECGIDDTMLSGVYNWAQSGAGYFYSYVKVRWAIQHDKQLKSVVVGYSYGDIAPGRDAWFSDKKYLARLKSYFPLLNGRDIWELLETNPQEVLLSLIQEIPYVGSRIIHSLGQHSSEAPRLGGFQHLERDKLQEAIARCDDSASLSPKRYSRYQERYLARIYELCVKNGIRLVLLNVPIYPILEDAEEGYKDHYYALVAERMPNAILVNHSNISIPDYGFGDLGHLNYKGAAIYTAYLKKLGIERGFSY